MAVELAQKIESGIQLNNIAAGFSLTDENRAILTIEEGMLTERGKTIIKLTLFKRFGETDELISTVLWFTNDTSKFVTSPIIPVDGGFNAFSGV